MKKRIRVYAFTAGIVVAIMAGIPPLDTVQWPFAVLAFLGLLVGVLNIRGKVQMDRFLISAIALITTTEAFLFFDGVPVESIPVIKNFELLITSALLYVSLAGLYGVSQERANTYKVWLHITAVVLVVVVGVVIGSDNKSVIQLASIGLLLVGLVAGYSEGPKNPEQMLAGKGHPYLISAVAFQISVGAFSRVSEADFPIYETFLKFAKVLLEKFAIFTTSALLVIAIMVIFWVLDDITDTSEKS